MTRKLSFDQFFDSISRDINRTDTHFINMAYSIFVFKTGMCATSFNVSDINMCHYFANPILLKEYIGTEKLIREFCIAFNLKLPRNKK